MKTPTYLFHKDFPKGKVFDAAVENMASLASQGWMDNPGLIGKGDPAKTLKQEPATTVDPGTGAEPGKEPDGTDLMAVFKAEPTKLTKDELVTLGKGLGINPIMKGWKEATLIKKVQDHLNGNH